MPKTLGIWEWGCPKRGDAQNAVTPLRRNTTPWDSCVTTTTTMHVQAAKALFYVIMHKVYEDGKV